MRIVQNKKKLTSANVETVKGTSEEKKGGVPNRVRASERSCSNPSEKKPKLYKHNIDI